MKGNFSTMEDLINEINRVEEAKKDLIVPHVALEMAEDNVLRVGGEGTFNIAPIAHQQIAEKLGIPKRYYDAMEAIPGLRAQNVNAWLKHTSDHRKLVRTLDGKSRAFLSDKFVPFDNFMVMQSFLPVLQSFNDIQITSVSMTELKMYVQIVFPSLKAEVKVGDVVQAGITLSNSEVGYGAVDVSTLVWRLRCLNGMIGQSLISRYHVGKRISEEMQESNIFKHDTILAEIESFRLRLRDVFRHALTEDVFLAQVNKIREAAGDKIDNPIRTVENVTKRFGFSEKEKEGMMAGMMAEGDTSRWGLVNSITALAKSIDNQDRQFQVERVGNDIIDLPASEWKVLTTEEVVA